MHSNFLNYQHAFTVRSMELHNSLNILANISAPHPRVPLGHPQPLEHGPRHQCDHGPPVLARHPQEPAEYLERGHSDTLERGHSDTVIGCCPHLVTAEVKSEVLFMTNGPHLSNLRSGHSSPI